jgi:hypothetical protein
MGNSKIQNSFCIRQRYILLQNSSAALFCGDEGQVRKVDKKFAPNKPQNIRLSITGCQDWPARNKIFYAKSVINGPSSNTLKLQPPKGPSPGPEWQNAQKS